MNGCVSTTVRLRVVLAALVAATLASVPSLAFAQLAYAPGTEILRSAPVARSSWVERLIVTEHRHLDVQAGFGFAYARQWPLFAGGITGPGIHAEANAGFFDRFDFGLRLGVRFAGAPTDPAIALQPDRFARIDRESFSRYSDGNFALANPAVRFRLAILNNAPFMLGLEVQHNLPVAGPNGFDLAVGVPMHIVIARRIRIETGAFYEMAWAVNGVGQPLRLDHQLHVPLRINIQLVPAVWVGVRSGVDLEFFWLNTTRQAWNVPLGVQGGVRVHPRVDIQWQIAFPSVLDPDVAVPFNTFAFGVSALIRAI